MIVFVNSPSPDSRHPSQHGGDATQERRQGLALELLRDASLRRIPASHHFVRVQSIRYRLYRIRKIRTRNKIPDVQEAVGLGGLPATFLIFSQHSGASRSVASIPPIQSPSLHMLYLLNTGSIS